MRRVNSNGFEWEYSKLFVVAMVFAVLSDGIKGRISEQRLLEVDTKLKMLNKPAVKSIQSEDGDIIDCVDVYKQPAFDHPALAKHKIQLKPTFNLATKETRTTSSTTEEKSLATSIKQLWQKSGSCPKGTVPIRRIRKQDLLRASSLENYGRKRPDISTGAPTPAAARNYTTFRINNTNQTNQFVHLNETGSSHINVIYPNRSMTYVITQGYNYIGAKADINTWNPHVEGNEDYSSAQIWLRNGPPNDYDSVEAGWIVNPAVYGDTQTRLFGYWTSDSSVTTGCFDLICSGFIQTGQIALGASLSPLSIVRGQQYIIALYILQDTNTGDWWLRHGETDYIGYWPSILFDYIARSAIMVMWGGEVYSPNVRKTPHTTTNMGSGNYAEGLLGSACFIEHIRIMDCSLAWKFPEWIATLADEAYCYHATLYRDGYLGEPEFYFGGPGRNYLCP